MTAEKRAVSCESQLGGHSCVWLIAGLMHLALPAEVLQGLRCLLRLQQTMISFAAYRREGDG